VLTPGATAGRQKPKLARALNFINGVPETGPETARNSIIWPRPAETDETHGGPVGCLGRAHPR
jgi:hypothetical protein